MKKQKYLIILFIVIAFLAILFVIKGHVNQTDENIISPSENTETDKNNAGDVEVKTASKNPDGTSKNTISTEMLSVCGNNLLVQKYFLNGVDVSKRIIDLVNNEYLVKQNKTETSCYWFNNRTEKIKSDNILETMVSDYPENLYINFYSKTDNTVYLDAGFIIDKNTFDIYNKNAYDGERGEKIGNLFVSQNTTSKDVNTSTTNPKVSTGIVKPDTGDLKERIVANEWYWVKTEKGLRPISSNTEVVFPKNKTDFILKFTTDGKLSIDTDCNSMSGTYSLEGIRLTFSPLVSTQMYCEGSVESKFSESIKTGTTYYLSFDETGDKMFIVSDETMYFVKK